MRRNSHLTQLMNSISFAHIVILLLCEHYRDNRRTDRFSLLPFESGLFDALSYSNLRSEDDDEFPRIDGPFAVLAVRKLDEQVKNRLEHIDRILLRPISTDEAERLEINRLLLVTDSDKPKFQSTDSDLHLEILGRPHLEVLYKRYGKRLPGTRAEARSRIVFYASEQQAKTPLYMAERERMLIHRHTQSQLLEAMNERSLVLFLGAGVTRDSGGPTWTGLLQYLKLAHMDYDRKISSNVDKDRRERIGRILGYVQKEDPLIEAQKLAYGLGDKFVERIKDSVYGNAKNPGPLLHRIAKLCKTGKVRAVVNYNWDDLLEDALRMYGLREDVDFVIVANDGYHLNDAQIPIYHVHGYLPRHGPKSIPIVFQEDEYHALYKQPHNWVNHVQIEALRECTCMFLGLSMTDPNLRRLLRIASNKHAEPIHVAIIRSPDFTGLRQNIRVQIEILSGGPVGRIEYPNESAVETIFRVQSMLNDTDLRSLKVNIDWQKEHKHFPEVIDELIGAFKTQGGSQLTVPYH